MPQFYFHLEPRHRCPPPQIDYFNRTLPSCAGGSNATSCFYASGSGAAGFRGGSGGAALDFWASRGNGSGSASSGGGGGAGGAAPDASDFGVHTSATYSRRFADLVTDHAARGLPGAEAAGPPARPLFVLYAMQLPHVPVQEPRSGGLEAACADLVRAGPARPQGLGGVGGGAATAPRAGLEAAASASAARNGGFLDDVPGGTTGGGGSSAAARAAHLAKREVRVWATQGSQWRGRRTWPSERITKCRR